MLDGSRYTFFFPVRINKLIKRASLNTLRKCVFFCVVYLSRSITPNVLFIKTNIGAYSRDYTILMRPT
ncbi:hypothetical protein FQR65_LT08321 [Abscondita terminalis]|nr:hypothetical protein FQR65_LT08321 [Abscondita terminalis]